MDYVTIFATQGLVFPIFLIASGLGMVLAEPFFPHVSKEDVARHHPAIQYLATRRWNRPGGTIMMAGGVFAILRLSS